MTHETAALNRAWPIICHLIGLVQLHLARLSSTNEQRWVLYPITRLAESLLRRWLVLSAYQDKDWPSLCQTKPTPVDTRERSTNARRPQGAPKFRLIEPLPGLAVWMFTPAPASEGAVDDAHPAFNPTRLRARIAALSVVVADPEIHIKRMARWLARAAARRAEMPCRTSPLGVGWPKGTSRAAKKRHPEWVSMVLYLDQLADAARRRGRSP